MSEFVYVDVLDLLASAGFARSDRTGREIGGFPEFSEGFIVSPDAPDSAMVMHLMGTGVRGECRAEVQPMLHKYREALVEGGFAAELREEPLLDLALIVKRVSA